MSASAEQILLRVSIIIRRWSYTRRESIIIITPSIWTYSPLTQAGIAGWWRM
jgi:hypothetical protein